MRGQEGRYCRCVSLSDRIDTRNGDALAAGCFRRQQLTAHLEVHAVWAEPLLLGRVFRVGRADGIRGSPEESLLEAPDVLDGSGIKVGAMPTTRCFEAHGSMSFARIMCRLLGVLLVWTRIFVTFRTYTAGHPLVAAHPNYNSSIEIVIVPSGYGSPDARSFGELSTAG